MRLVVGEYTEHYNRHRPHRSLGQRAPDRLTDLEPPIARDHTRISVDAIDSAALSTNTRRSHRVAQIPAPTGLGSAVARLAHDLLRRGRAGRAQPPLGCVGLELTGSWAVRGLAASPRVAGRCPSCARCSR
ncbi:hypothetical protein [Streptomyces endocoffeicus]|uniref:hypothetical protein n=1 Tax=Streptomyces endocoffeicus TaxID=2898945 RepID=UPI0027DE4149|nr:hypothetical protein [Streptomyces endocoffeicus]